MKGFKLNALCSLGAGLFATSAIAVPPAGTPYHTDPQQTWVEDQSSESIRTVNMILCYIDAMKPSDMVNQGNYLALVDDNQCEDSKRSDPNQASNTSGNSGAQYSSAIVNSSRADNNSPMIGKVWVEESGDDFMPPATIFVRTTVNEAPSDDAKMGVFSMNFGGRADSGGTLMFQGRLNVTAAGLEFAEKEFSHNFSNKIYLEQPTDTTGKGVVMFTDNNISKTFTFGYNATHFCRQMVEPSSGPKRCFSRQATQAKGSVWRYGLYDDNGAKVELASPGFSVTYDNNGTSVFGHASYWGLWLEDNLIDSIPNGASLTRQSNNATYTLVKGDGKLLKYQKQVRTLNSINKIRFNTGMEINNSFMDLEGAWDQSQQKFIFDKQQQCGQNGCSQTPLQTPVEITANNVQEWGIHGWSRALGGQVFIPKSAVQTPAAQEVVTYQESVVPVGQYPTTLHCVSDCIGSTELTGFATGNQSHQHPHVGDSYRQHEVTNLVSYTSNGSVLSHLGSPIAMPANPDNDRFQGDFQWGIRSGAMVTTNSGLECEHDQNKYCSHKLHNAAEYYVYETGIQDWNKSMTLLDGNNTPVNFTPPMQVNFSVPNDSTTYGNYAGTNITLEYGGFGDLWGIPGVCIDPDTNQEADCGPGTRYVPSFTIPFNTTTGIVQEGSNTYYVKWLERELRFAEDNLSPIADGDMGDINTLPGDDFINTDPSDPADASYIGAKPTIDTEPAVIHGVIQ
ncbi:hypothetical protein [Dongshaea marina]|uniref:hypothetical protein n=1 Tax=Dongshaea marina TaxID=2047966 RepID=UPI000D3E92B5|nr:hypothetical protein [Dongshaea marina]